MGADILVAWVDFPANCDLMKEHAKLIELAEQMNEEEIEYTIENVFYEPVEDFTKAKKKIIETIEKGFKALISRQSTWIIIENRRVYLTGGLSWGDAPTERYEEVNALAFIKGMFE